jgi:tRNA threonylcarbamoyladenosine biosynthesis protein TsaB
MPVLLVFDTSGERLAAGLVTDAGRWEHEGPGGAQASAALLPALHALMARAGVAWRDLDAIGFGQGPGAFTGLRTACAVAQGLAEGLACPVLPLDTLEAVALDAWRRAGRGRPERIGVAQDARMGEVYAATYDLDAVGASRVRSVPALWTPDALLEAWLAAMEAGPGATPPTRVAGSAVPVIAARPGVVAARAAGSLALDDVAWPSPPALLDLGLQRWAEGATVDAANARPAYVRDRVAQTTVEREARAAAANALR